MKNPRANQFTAMIDIIGVNPFVYLPDQILEAIFLEAGKDKGKIPVVMKIDGHEFIQTLIKYSDHWHFLNIPMLNAAKKEVGDEAVFKVVYDSVKREITPHPKFVKALQENKKAKAIFDDLRPSL